MAVKPQQMRTSGVLRGAASRMFHLDSPKQAPSVSPPLSDALVCTLQELSVYPIELELQHADLLRVQQALATSRVRHFELYDLAPVGYLTIRESGGARGDGTV